MRESHIIHYNFRFNRFRVVTLSQPAVQDTIHCFVFFFLSLNTNARTLCIYLHRSKWSTHNRIYWRVNCMRNQDKFLLLNVVASQASGIQYSVAINSIGTKFKIFTQTPTTQDPFNLGLISCIIICFWCVTQNALSRTKEIRDLILHREYMYKYFSTNYAHRMIYDRLVLRFFRFIFSIISN